MDLKSYNKGIIEIFIVIIVAAYQYYYMYCWWCDYDKRKKLNWGENPVRDLPGRWAIVITIYNSDDKSQ